MLVDIVRSKSGIPCLIERGGCDGNSGAARVITGPLGEKKRALYISRGNPNGEHAVIPLLAGDFVIDVLHDSQRFATQVWGVRIIGEEVAQLEQLVQFNGEIGENLETCHLLTNNICQAIDAAIKLSTTVNATAVTWALDPAE